MCAMRDLTTAAAVSTAPRTGWRAYLELSKARLSLMVVLTSGFGFILADSGRIDWVLLAWTLLGTTLSAFGANAMNQWCERDFDAKMRRTSDRPLPARRLTSMRALTFGIVTCAAGPLILLATVNALTAWLAVITEICYLALYTPMKRRSTFCTLAGAVCGALPPMMGWSAVTGGLEPGAWMIGAILFAWQIPHFMALAWMYRDDYALGGFRMLPVVDRSGRMTGQVTILYSLALVVLGLMPAMAGVAGWASGIGTGGLGVVMLILSLRLHHARTERSARNLFVASLVYLPAFMLITVLDRAAVPVHLLR